MDSTRLLALLVAVVIIAGIVWFFALPQGTAPVTSTTPEVSTPAEPAPAATPEAPPAPATP